MPQESDQFKELQSLLQLKRHETPGEEYFQKFQQDFREVQRAELLKRSARGLFFERVKEFFGAQLVWQGAAVAGILALLSVSFFLGQSADPESAVAEVQESQEVLGGALAYTDSRSFGVSPLGQYQGVSIGEF